MSVEVVSWYLDQSEQDGPRLLALLSLAEWADKNGACYPSIASIGRRLRRSERTAQAVINELEQAGELLVAPGAGQLTQGGCTTRYYLLAYMEANDITVPPEHIKAATQRERDRKNGQKGQQTKASPNKGVQKPAPPKDPKRGEGLRKGVQESAPVDSQKRGEDSDKGVKVYVKRGEGLRAKGVQKPAPKPNTDPTTTEPSFNSERDLELDGTIAAGQPPAAEPPHPPPQPHIDLALPNPPTEAEMLNGIPEMERITSVRVHHRFSSVERAYLRSPPMQGAAVTVEGYVPAGQGTNPLQVFHERNSIREVRLSAPQQDDLATAVTDLARWREAVTAWSSAGYKARNLAGQLDWYRNGLPTRNGNGQREFGILQNGTNHHEQPKVSPEEEQRIREWNRRVAAERAADEANGIVRVDPFVERIKQQIAKERGEQSADEPLAQWR